MFLSLLFFLYTPLIPYSALMKSYCFASLSGTSDAIFYAPSLLGKSGKIGMSVTTLSYVPELRIFSFSLSNKGSCIASSFMGTSDINEKSLFVGTTKHVEACQAGFSIKLTEKSYEEINTKSLSILASLSNNSSEIIYGIAGLYELPGRKVNTTIFSSIRNSLGNIYFNLAFQGGLKIFSIAQDLTILPLINLSIGLINNPKSYYLGFCIRNYIKPAVSFIYIPELGFATTCGIEYTY